MLRFGTVPQLSPKKLIRSFQMKFRRRKKDVTPILAGFIHIVFPASSPFEIY